MNKSINYISVQVCGVLSRNDDRERFEKYNHIPPGGPLGLMAGEWTFKYDYPLSNEVEFKHHLAIHSSYMDIMDLAATDYRKIYDEETESMKSPIPEVPMRNNFALTNRAKSDGKYGIWGHVIEDLYFESIYIDEEAKVITFDIGS